MFEEWGENYTEFTLPFLFLCSYIFACTWAPGLKTRHTCFTVNKKDTTCLFFHTEWIAILEYVLLKPTLFLAFYFSLFSTSQILCLSFILSVLGYLLIPSNCRCVYPYRCISTGNITMLKVDFLGRLVLNLALELLTGRYKEDERIFSVWHSSISCFSCFGSLFRAGLELW